jgi:hypothetical protein
MTPMRTTHKLETELIIRKISSLTNFVIMSWYDESLVGSVLLAVHLVYFDHVLIWVRNSYYVPSNQSVDYYLIGINIFIIDS